MKQSGRERRRPGLASNLSRLVVSVQTDLSRRVNINLADFICLRTQIYGDLFMLLEPKRRGKNRVGQTKSAKFNKGKTYKCKSTKSKSKRAGKRR